MTVFLIYENRRCVPYDVKFMNNSSFELPWLHDWWLVNNFPESKNYMPSVNLTDIFCLS